jgi:hypothetical protein
MNRMLPHLARVVSSPAAIDAFARRPELRPLLRPNPHLPPDLWWSLWKEKPDQYQACALLSHPIDPEHLEHILGRERRRKVLATIVECQEFTAGHLEIMRIRGLLNSGSIARVVAHGRYPADGETLLLSALPDGHWRRAHAARSRHQFDQDVMLAACADVARGGLSPWWVADEIAVHPNAEAKVQVEALAALAAHPVTTGHSYGGRRDDVAHLPALTRPWEEVTTDDELDLLGQLRDLKHVPATAAARIRARQLTRAPDPDPLETAKQASAPVNETSWSPLVPLACGYLDARLDQAGPGTWDVAITLLSDGYAGTAEELVTTATALAPAPAQAPAGPTAAAPRVSIRRASHAPAADQPARGNA